MGGGGGEGALVGHRERETGSARGRSPALPARIQTAAAAAADAPGPSPPMASHVPNKQGEINIVISSRLELQREDGRRRSWAEGGDGAVRGCGMAGGQES